MTTLSFAGRLATRPLVYFMVGSAAFSSSAGSGLRAAEVTAAGTDASGPAENTVSPSNGDSIDLNLDVIAKRLDTARSQIQPSLGATRYDFSRPAIETQPQGDNAPFNTLLLQAPGVAQDSFGQLHVRGDHANLQYRLNGVQLPEGINVFGQALETRLANSVSLITGALPAQYGFRTAGIIDIQTKTGTLNPGGAATLYGGTHSTFQPSVEFGGRLHQIDYFATGEYLRSNVGIENPTNSFTPIHDRTRQERGFAYMSDILDPATRVSLILGTSHSQFQIPNNPGQSPDLGLTVNGLTNVSSRSLDENQREITHYGIGALQKHVEALDFQLSVFSRYSSVYFSPDPLGDLLFNGISQKAYRRSVAAGSQLDGSYRISGDHTLRMGLLVQGERASAKTHSAVLPVDANGMQTSDQPISILNHGGKTGWMYGAYVQDEWRIAQAVTVNFGARFDRVDEYTHEQQLSPRVNVVWEPASGTALHAGYARYFTPPPFELLAPSTLAEFVNTSGASEVTQDSVVKAERAHYFDVGASQILLPGLKVGVDAYYKIAKNLIDEGQFGAPVILTPFNYKKGLVRGVEFATSYDIERWSLYGNFAVSKAQGKKITSGQFNFGQDELDYIARHYIYLDHNQTYSASAGVAYMFPWQMRASADVIYGSGLRADGSHPNGRALPNYAQVNVGLVQQIATGFLKGAEVRLDVINLFDNRYEIRDGTGVGVGAPQFGPRRTILAGLTQRF